MLARRWNPGLVRSLLSDPAQVERVRLEAAQPGDGLFDDGYQLSEQQAREILEMRLARLTGLEQDKLVEEYRSLLELLRELFRIIEDPDRLLEVIREDYVRTARAKGFGRHRVIVLHALPNALLPVITLSGILLGFVLAGSIPVERAFGTPGLGYAMFTAVNERDVFVMQNLVFLYAVVFVVLNILIDITIAWIDPRIRYQ